MAKNEFIKAGELDTPIQVWSYSAAQNEYGEVIKSKVLLKTVWAKMITTGTKGNEKVEDDTIRAESKINFLVRPDELFKMNNTSTSPENFLTIYWEGKYWNISSMEDMGRGKGLLMRCYFTDNTLK